MREIANKPGAQREAVSWQGGRSVSVNIGSCRFEGAKMPLERGREEEEGEEEMDRSTFCWLTALLSFLSVHHGLE